MAVSTSSLLSSQLVKSVFASVFSGVVFSFSVRGLLLLPRADLLVIGMAGEVSVLSFTVLVEDRLRRRLLISGATTIDSGDWTKRSILNGVYLLNGVCLNAL